MYPFISFIKGDEMKYLYSDARRPLPDQTYLRCDECYAKVLLEELFPNSFENLQIIDAPDLRSEKNDIGIEVTSSIPSDSHCAESLYSKWSTLSISETSPETKARMCQLEKKITSRGANLSGGILSGPNGVDSFSLVLEAVKSKLKKLRAGNYAEMSEYQLFVQSDILASSEMLKGASKAISSLCSKEILPTFSVVYVNVPGYVYLFDAQKNEDCIYPVSVVLQRELAERARAMVIEEEVSRINALAFGNDGAL